MKGQGQLHLSGGRRLKSPNGLATRPTSARVREAVMNLVGPKLVGCHWLDLFSGSGVMGCEAIQRGAHRVVAVERDHKTAEICNSNLKSTASGISHCCDVHVIKKEVVGWLKKGLKEKMLTDKSLELNRPFDVVYIDPPYKANLYQSVLNSLLLGNWLKKESLVICEHSKQSLLEPPIAWVHADKRVYGNTALLLISPLESYLYGTGSKHLQKGPE